MMQAGCFNGRWPVNLLIFLLVGTNLFIFGLWCMASHDFPPPSWALPLPQQLLSGMAFMLLIPPLLVPLTLFFTWSLLLGAKLGRVSAVAVAVVVVAFAVAGSLWVPNPVVDWPISILGDHTVAELVGELFPFHIVPTPGAGVDLGSASGFHSLVHWQFEECSARFGILMSLWAGYLVTIWKVDRKLSTARTLRPTAVLPGG